MPARAMLAVSTQMHTVCELETHRAWSASRVNIASDHNQGEMEEQKKSKTKTTKVAVELVEGGGSGGGVMARASPVEEVDEDESSAGQRVAAEGRASGADFRNVELSCQKPAGYMVGW
ncbi:hypothetical protein Tdes44962_MAKER08456 [Teratosphaeria destructans]|uniref:Uncharacterized protein n=1 Tax=Teratosphaeria destructans TaxID=418781 RepID=A0A9W7SWK1_9PEZI|nr:hypothetical protein Tdes44962_MAKER08456 [Teratosphaeria destructans]